MATAPMPTPQREAHGVYTIDGLRRYAKTRPAYLIDGLLMARSTNILVGDSGLGKTPFNIQLGLCVSAGVPFLGHPVVQGPVLFCDAESNIHEFINTCERVSTFLGLSRVPDQFEVWSPNFDQTSSSSVSFAVLLEQRVRLVQPALVIVDPLRFFWPLAEEKNPAAVALYTTQKQLTKDVGCTWLTSHHRRKTNTNYQANLEVDRHRWFEEAAGSRALVNQSDTRLGLEPTAAASGAELVFAGFMRSVGWLEPRYLKRVRDEVGDPVGYELLQGLSLLSQAFQQAYVSLPDRFRYTDAKNILGGTSDSGTKSFLDQCRAAGLLKRDDRGYVKG